MKKLIAFMTLLFLFFSCSTTPVVSNFKIVSRDRADLLITWNEFSGNKNPSRIQYLVNGSIANNSTNIYKKAIVRLDIVFTLDNGNELSLNEIDRQNMFGGFTGSDFIYNWKPKEQKPFKLKSPSIDVLYIDYPITKVIATYSIEAVDEINNRTVTEVVEKIDITAKWKETVKKVKAGVTDVSPSQLYSRI